MSTTCNITQQNADCAQDADCADCAHKAGMMHIISQGLLAKAVLRGGYCTTAPERLSMPVCERPGVLKWGLEFVTAGRAPGASEPAAFAPARAGGDSVAFFYARGVPRFGELFGGRVGALGTCWEVALDDAAGGSVRIQAKQFTTLLENGVNCTLETLELLKEMSEVAAEFCVGYVMSYETDPFPG